MFKNLDFLKFQVRINKHSLGFDPADIADENRDLQVTRYCTILYICMT